MSSLLPVGTKYHYYSFFLLFFGSIVLGCHYPKPTNTSHHAKRQDNPKNYEAIDSSIKLLHNGDIALRTGADVISVMLRGMNQEDKTYSHCGIVMIENGYPFVYHSIGGEDNPDARLQRDSAKQFFSPVSNERLGIARLPLSPLQIEQLHQIVRRYYAAKTLFDMDFDLKTNDKLYCAEFVYKSVEEAVRDTNYFSTSEVLSRRYVAVDNITDRKHAKMICEVQYKL
ncbi:MAG: hypothetical protein JST36_08745 [Bacteroidetes bacterium]|nr:hypothetical protein [Bacteroidota bacterium]